MMEKRNSKKPVKKVHPDTLKRLNNLKEKISQISEQIESLNKRREEILLFFLAVKQTALENIYSQSDKYDINLDTGEIFVKNSTTEDSQ